MARSARHQFGSQEGANVIEGTGLRLVRLRAMRHEYSVSVLESRDGPRAQAGFAGRIDGGTNFSEFGRTLGSLAAFRWGRAFCPLAAPARVCFTKRTRSYPAQEWTCAGSMQPKYEFRTQWMAAGHGVPPSCRKYRYICITNAVTCVAAMTRQVPKRMYSLTSTREFRLDPTLSGCDSFDGVHSGDRTSNDGGKSGMGANQSPRGKRRSTNLHGPQV